MSHSPGPARPPGLRTFLLLLIVLAGPRAGAQTTVGAMTFASEGVTINTNQPGYAYLTNGTLTLTADISSQATSAYLNSLVSIREFSASFTYTATTSGGFFADGAAFVIQNSPQQASALGTAGSGLGYEGITSSAALAFNIYGGHPIGITLARDGYLNNYQYTGTGNVSLV